MAKNKSSEIPCYELLYIISNKYSENELKPIVEKVNKIIKDNKGQIIKTEDWGKKKLAYSIEHFDYGYYNLAEFNVAGDAMAKINQALRLNREILRHQIVVKKIKTEAEIKKEKEISKKITAQTAAKEQENIKKEELDKEKTNKKIDLKELDKKLDKILETDDLL